VTPTVRTGADRRGAAVGVALLALSGCAGAVEARAPAGSEAAECVAAAAAWPQTVAHRERRETSADSAAVAAWGDPPVVARCGLTPPSPTTDDCLQVSGVDWVVHRLSDGVRFTTYGREPAIEVLVPSELAPESLVLPAFGAAAQALRRQPGRGCR
jgi:hypothetical protein